MEEEEEEVREVCGRQWEEEQVVHSDQLDTVQSWGGRGELDTFL